jgi:hypothetical protein
VHEAKIMRARSWRVQHLAVYPARSCRNVFVYKFPRVCPAPVLANIRFLVNKWRKNTRRTPHPTLEVGTFAPSQRPVLTARGAADSGWVDAIAAANRASVILTRRFENSRLSQ